LGMLKEPAAHQHALEMVTLESLVPEDHLLRQIDAFIAFDFIRDKVRHLERDWCPATFSDLWSDLVCQKAASWSSKLTNEEICTMKDLNYQLSKLCRDNHDGGFSTQATRSRSLDLIASQLQTLGYRRMQPRSLKPKHVDALIAHWRNQGISVGTLKNRLSALRWWAGRSTSRASLPKTTMSTASASGNT